MAVTPLNSPPSSRTTPCSAKHRASASASPAFSAAKYAATGPGSAMDMVAHPPKEVHHVGSSSRARIALISGGSKPAAWAAPMTVSGQHVDRDVPFEARVARTVDLAHTP